MLDLQFWILETPSAEIDCGMRIVEGGIRSVGAVPRWLG